MLPNLYILRFLLATFVVIFHVPGVSKTLGYPFYNELPLFMKGHLAVYYFFTLSGFLIIRLIYLELAKKGDFDFKAFYIRRIQRLYPVYYLVFVVGFLLYHVVLPSLGIDRPIDYSVKDLFLYYIFFIPNIFHYYYTPGSILNILWSIGIEEQFYLFIPLLLYIGRKNLARAITIIFIISITVLFLYPDFYKYHNYFFFFLFGGFCSIISEKYSFQIFKNKGIHFVVYTMFLLSFFTNIFNFENQTLYLLINMLISGFIITLITYYPIFRIANSFLNHLGKISYGIYMYHMIVITGLFFVVEKTHYKELVSPTVFIISINLIALGITAFVSHLSYQYFEKLFYKPRM